MDNEISQQPVAQEQPGIPTEISSHSHTVRLIIVGLVMLLLGLGGGYVLFAGKTDKVNHPADHISQQTEVIPTRSQVNSPTSMQKISPTSRITSDGLRTYSGKFFTFNYPSHGSILTDSPTQIYLSANTEPYYTFSVNIEDNVNKLTTKQVVDNLITDIRNNKNSPSAKAQADQMQKSMKDYLVDTISGIKLQSFDEGYPQAFGKVVVVKGDKIYTFHIGDGSGGSVGLADEQRLDEILSSFKFIN